jgi:hypothetical protein
MPDVTDPEQLLALIEEVYAITEPQEELDVDDLLEFHPAMWSIFGLLQESRRLLEGITALVRAGKADCSEALVRSVVEHYCTATWLWTNTEAAFPVFMGANLHDLRELEKLHPEIYGGERRQFEEAMKRLVGEATPARIPSLKVRAAEPPANFFYAQYRNLCRRVHSTQFASSTLWALSDDDTAKVAEASRDDVPYLIHLALIMVWDLGRRIEHLLGFGLRDDDYQEVYARLDSVTEEFERELEGHLRLPPEWPE